MKGIKFAGLALLAGASGGMAQQTLSVYGFMDFNVEKTFMKENNFLRSFLSSDIEYGLNHANLYFDFNPNPSSRALVEIGYNQPSVLQEAITERVFNVHAPALVINGNPVAPEVNLEISGNRPDEEPRKATLIQNFSLERAWLEIKMNRYANFRFGRFITPAGIWNVDHGSPVILTVAQPYQTSLLPIFPVRQDGVMLNGATYFGDHDVEYKLYLSKGSSIDNEIKDMNDVGGGGNARISLDLPVTVKAGLSGYSGMIRNTYLRQEFDLETTVPDLAGMQTDPAAFGAFLAQFDWAESRSTNVVTTETRQFCYGADLLLEFEGLGLQGEYNMKKEDNERDNSDDMTSWYAWYVLANYRIRLGERSLIPYFKFERLWWEDLAITGNGLAATPLAGFQSYMIGINFAITANTRLKLEGTYSVIETNDYSLVGGMEVPHSYDDSELNTYGVSSQVSIAF